MNLEHKRIVEHKNNVARKKCDENELSGLSLCYGTRVRTGCHSTA